MAQMYSNSCVHELSSLFRYRYRACVSFSLGHAKRPHLWFLEVTAAIVVQIRRLHVSRQHKCVET